MKMEMKLEREFIDMNEIIQTLEASETNGNENFCCISESCLSAMKELSKRDYQEFQELKEKQEKCMSKNRGLDSNNRLLVQELKDYKKENQKLKRKIKELENSNVIDGQMTIDDLLEENKNEAN